MLNSTTSENLEVKIEEEFKILLSSEDWAEFFLPLPKVDVKNYSRTRKKNVNLIDEVKDKVMSAMGSMVIHFTLHVLSKCGALASPYNKLESYLLLIFQL